MGGTQLPYRDARMALAVVIEDLTQRPARPAGNTVMEPGFLYQEAGHHDDKALPLSHAA